MVIKRSNRKRDTTSSPSSVEKEKEHASTMDDTRSVSPVPGLSRSSPPESPVPVLRSSSMLSSATLSSFDYDLPEVESSDESSARASSRFTMLCQNKAFKWILGAVVKLVIMYLLLKTQHKRVDDTASVNNTNNSSAENKLLNKLKAIPTTQQELSDVNKALAGLHPELILKWAHHHVHASSEMDDSHPLVQATSFGPTGLVILDLLSVNNLLDTVPVITMDTLHLFQESYTFYDTVQSHYKSPLHLTITKPLDMIEEHIMSKAEFNDAYSSTLWKTDPKLYTKVTKLEPMHQKLEEWNAVMWITGRRRSQGGERVKLDVLEFEPYPQGSDMGSAAKSSPFHSSKGRWKLNPLAYWSYDKVWSYIRNNNVPYNPLYDQGYTSIGDEMTTSKPEKADEGVEHAHLERSGRFAGFGESNKECGLHVDFDLDPADNMKLDDEKDEENEFEDAGNVTCDIDMARQGECAEE
jgi:phosphoadenosine phosphosulfate reductase